MADVTTAQRVAPPPGLIAPEQARIGEEPMVRGVFPKNIILTTDNQKRVQFLAGINQVPHHLARHWYLQAQGVEMDPIPDYEPPAKEGKAGDASAPEVAARSRKKA